MAGLLAISLLFCGHTILANNIPPSSPSERFDAFETQQKREAVEDVRVALKMLLDRTADQGETWTYPKLSERINREFAEESWFSEVNPNYLKALGGRIRKDDRYRINKSNTTFKALYLYLAINRKILDIDTDLRNILGIEDSISPQDTRDIAQSLMTHANLENNPNIQTEIDLDRNALDCAIASENWHRTERNKHTPEFEEIFSKEEENRFSTIRRSAFEDNDFVKSNISVVYSEEFDQFLVKRLLKDRDENQVYMTGFVQAFRDSTISFMMSSPIKGVYPEFMLFAYPRSPTSYKKGFIISSAWTREPFSAPILLFESKRLASVKERFVLADVAADEELHRILDKFLDKPKKLEDTTA